jgi:hypothetical protein
VLGNKAIFMEALGKRFADVIDLDSIMQLRPDIEDFDSVVQLLQLNRTMTSLYDEVMQACQVIFQDDHARLDRSNSN